MKYDANKTIAKSYFYSFVIAFLILQARVLCNGNHSMPFAHSQYYEKKLLRTSSDINSYQHPGYFSTFQDSNVLLLGTLESEHCSQIIVANNLCYRNNGRYFEIIDLSDVGNPLLISSISFPAPISAFLLYNQYAIIADSDSGIFIYDLSDLGEPVEIISSHIAIPSSCLAINDSILFSCREYWGIYAFDISNIATPIQIGYFTWGSTGKTITVYDNKLYFPSYYPDGIYVLGATTSNLLEELGFLYTMDIGAIKVILRDSIAYCGGWQGLITANVKQSDSMYVISVYDSASYIYDMSINDNYLFLASGQNGLKILNIGNSESLFEVGGLSIKEGYIAKGIFLQGNYVYLANDVGGMQILETQDNNNINIVSEYSRGFQNRCGIGGVYVDGNNVYLSDFVGYLHVVTVNDFNEISLKSSIKVGSFNSFVFVENNVAYVPSEDSLFIIDVSNPDSMSVISILSGLGLAWGVYVRGDYAYITDELDGFYIVDMSELDNPQIISLYPAEHGMSTAYFIGDTAYIAADETGLLILDVSDPSNPVQIGSVDTESNAWGIWVSGNYAYIADNADGLVIIDVSEPTSPQIINVYDSGYYAWGVQVVGNYAFVANNGTGLEIVDVSDPYNPTEYGRFVSKPVCLWLEVIGNKAYLANDDDGFTLLSIDGLPTSTRSDQTVLPSTYAVFNNYPNPFNSTTVFQYKLTNTSHVILSVYDLKGRIVDQIVQGLQDKGQHYIKWQAADLSSGEYIAVLSIEGKGIVKRIARKVLLLK